MAPVPIYPNSPKDALHSMYVGKTLHEALTPAAVMDVAAVRRNCGRMLQATRQLGLGWRAHVKTHKALEITRLQVGDKVDEPVNLIVSTIAELSFLLPLLKEYRSQGRSVNVLHGLPVAPRQMGQMISIAEALGPDSISFLVDDPAQIPVASSFNKANGVKPHLHVKIDMGGRRAGVIVNTPRFTEVVDAALEAHKQGHVILRGVYSHAGHSYAGDSRVAAMKMLSAEIEAMLEAATAIVAKAAEADVSSLPKLCISAGASPTALSVQNLLENEGMAADDKTPELKQQAGLLRTLFDDVKAKGHEIEIHAGVYPTLDLQQLAAHSISSSHLSWGDIAFTLLAEVHSFYPGRGENGRAEALIGAGVLALGRETCKAYEGLALLTPWNRPGAKMPDCDVEDVRGWMVGRFSQEHGILTWREGKRGFVADDTEQDALQCGQLVRLWPNHACITSGQFGFYIVVDGDRQGKEDEIVDIWVRATGW
ncbi:alanine racemase domain protein [Stachybotrys elegans]|uniref:Alanine racemase domain protein n=1 Tax=Stachybotrys elegans TaxID=80388 RepID=A0A8K0WLU8_9HYPO|nr:alanine racemase domain protein [Stachybotrys elegans]